MNGATTRWHPEAFGAGPARRYDGRPAPQPDPMSALETVVRTRLAQFTDPHTQRDLVSEGALRGVGVDGARVAVDDTAATVFGGVAMWRRTAALRSAGAVSLGSVPSSSDRARKSSRSARASAESSNSRCATSRSAAVSSPSCKAEINSWWTGRPLLIVVREV